MITARQMLEEYLLGYRGTGSRVGDFIEVYVNPTKGDFMALGQDDIRFTANIKDKRVYVWGIDNEIHHFMCKRIGIPFMRYYEEGLLLNGTAERRGIRYVMRDSDAISPNYEGTLSNCDKKTLLRDWEWVDKYILVSPWLERTRIEWGEVL